MAIVERIGADAISDGFARLLEAASPDDATPRLGVEREYLVRGPDGPIDYRRLSHRLAPLGIAVHPTDPLVHLTPRGVMLLADYDVAEAATPPVRVHPGCVDRLAAWAAEGTRLLAGTLGPALRLDGASTHISVETPAPIADRLAIAYAATYAPGMMLLLDRAGSPGVLVRPRPGRTEICGEYAEGAQLRAAIAYAAGSVLAASEDLLAGVWAGPRPVDVEIEPARRRFGWFVARDAFGDDLYRHGRAAPLRVVGGGTTSAQAHLERGWERARRALAPFVGEDDLRACDDAVARRAALPVEAVAADDESADPPPAATIGRATARRVRGDLTVDLHTATWDVACFAVHGPSRGAIAVVPHRHLEAFLDLLDEGELDQMIEAYLERRAVPAERVVARARDTEGPGLHDALRRSADLLPDDRMGVGPGAVDPVRPGKRLVPPVAPPPVEVVPPGAEPPPPPDGPPPPAETPPTGGGGPPWTWIVGIAVVVVVAIVGVTTATGGGGEGPGVEPTQTRSEPPASSPPPAEGVIARPLPGVCDLISAAEVGSIVGRTMVSQPQRPGEGAGCRYLTTDEADIDVTTAYPPFIRVVDLTYNAQVATYPPGYIEGLFDALAAAGGTVPVRGAGIRAFSPSPDDDSVQAYADGVHAIVSSGGTLRPESIRDVRAWNAQLATLLIERVADHA